MARKAKISGENQIAISEVFRRRGVTSPYDEVATQAENTFLRTESGSKPVLPPRVLGRFVREAATWYGRQKFLERGARTQAKREGFLKGVAASYNGVRGASRLDAFKTNVFPQHSIAWRREGLQNVLGSAYSTVIDEDAELKIAVPLGRETPQGPLTAEMVVRAAKIGFLALEFSEDELATIFDARVTVRVSEGQLESMVANGQITNIDEAGTATQTWVIKAGQ